MPRQPYLSFPGRQQPRGRLWCLALLLITSTSAINAELGHLGGDVILRELAQTLAKNVNDGDLVARYGGEEFVVTAVETPLAAAEAW